MPLNYSMHKINTCIMVHVRKQCSMRENYKLQNCAIFAAIIAGVGPMQISLHACRLHDRVTPNNRDLACRYIHTCMHYIIFCSGITHFFITNWHTHRAVVARQSYMQKQMHTTQSFDHTITYN